MNLWRQPFAPGVILCTLEWSSSTCARSTVNFTVEDLREIAERCHAKNVKAYLTLNTILYDHDVNLMKGIVDQAKVSGISAVIASDHAVMSYCRKIGMPLHISTQANVTNIETVEFYAAFADVMVLSRELSLGRLPKLAEKLKGETSQVHPVN